MSRDLISVVIPAWNAAPFIQETLASLLRQSHRNLEVVVVDDCSTDDTAEKVEAFADSRVKLVRSEKNRGAAAALLRGIQESSGTWIARSDADDLSSPRRLSVQLRLAQFLGENYILGSSALLTGNGRGFVSKRVTHNQLLSQLFFQSPLIHSSVFAHRAIFERFPYNPGFVLEDYDWLERAVRGGVRLFNVPLPLVRYRLHSSMKSKNLAGRGKADWLSVAGRFIDDLATNVSPEELDIYYAMAIREPSALRQGTTFADAVAWKNRLIGANDRERVFPRQYFRQVLDNRLKTLSPGP